MGRKARFTKTDFIESALDLLAEQGLSGVTITAIAKRVGAPTGSVYHRFASRDILLAELWVALIEFFQAGFIRLLKKDDARKAAAYTLNWVRRHPNKARVFLLHRREQLVSGEWPGEVKARVMELNKNLQTHLRAFTNRNLGSTERQNMDRVVFSLIHVPMSAARDYLEAGKPIPRFYDQLVMETFEAVLAPYLVAG